MLDYSFANSVLNISAKDGADPIEFMNLNSIHFGEKAKDINLCNSSTQYYMIDGDKLPDLSGNNVTFNLRSMTPGALRDLTM